MDLEPLCHFKATLSWSFVFHSQPSHRTHPQMPSTHFVSVQQSPDVDTHFSGRTSNSSGSVSHDAPLVLLKDNPERRQAAGRREVALAHYDVEGGPSEA